MSDTPSFQEDHISQVPALQLLQNLGYTYLRPQEVMLQRKGRLRECAAGRHPGGATPQDEPLQLPGRAAPVHGGQHPGGDPGAQGHAVRRAGADERAIYDLLVLGKAMEQTIDGDRKSFTLQYIDWRNPANNVFHVVEEFEVERTGSNQLCRPDLVLFVNGIPFA